MDLAFLVRVGQFLKQQGYLGAKHFLVLSCFSKAAKGLSRREGAAARLFSPLPQGTRTFKPTGGGWEVPSLGPGVCRRAKRSERRALLGPVDGQDTSWLENLGLHHPPGEAKGHQSITPFPAGYTCPVWFSFSRLISPLS